MVATRGRTFKRPWRRSCLSSKLKSSSAPIGRKDSWCFHAVGSSNAPLLGSTAAEGLPRIGRTSIATRWRSCGLPQSASCCENFVIPPDVFGQTLREVIPKLSRVIVLSNPENPVVVLSLQETRAAAQTFSLKLDSVDMRKPSELDRALSVIVGTRPDALALLEDSMILSQRTQIATFALEHRLPSISPFREFTEVGGLMSYGASIPDLYRRAAGYIKRILEGAKPAELPIEQPTKFELVINLKTAKALGLTVPPSLLARVDEVIE